LLRLCRRRRACLGPTTARWLRWGDPTRPAWPARNLTATSHLGFCLRTRHAIGRQPGGRFVGGCRGSACIMRQHQQRRKRTLEVAGTTYAAEAGIRIDDKPMPLFQLLVLCMLASKPIDSTIATRAARELFKAGLRTPKAILTSDRRTMINAFGRAHYVR